MSPRPCAPPPRHSGRLLVRLAPGDVAIFRFFLEAYENLALFTVLERKAALLKVVFSPRQEDAVRRALAEIGASVPLAVGDWPFARPED
ncbi:MULTISPECIES: DUF4911 domain-containing protein [unclassified Desulfovibrio]|uniref:DUF4911 domain-containing protein n=1 Tax=unclassified Desulfovibrio TaxID=2593640 RepID=UPI0013EAFAC4|nr:MULTISPECIES: DUF4911 domain-containing protein [unclassified Desulfovibrio]